MKITAKNLVSLGIGTAFALVICSPFASAQSSNDVSRRGALEVTGRSARVVTAGPVLMHSYSGFSGGSIFVALLVTGTDADCSSALKTSSQPSPLIADHISVIEVGPKEIACLTTDSARSYELLWHAFFLTDARVLVAKAGKRL